MKYKKILKYNFGTKENPCQISTLDELLELITSNKIILIEIKEESKNIKEIVNIIYNIISKHSHLNIYIASFNYELIKYFNSKYEKCGLIIGNGLNTDKLYNHFYFNMISYQYRYIIKKKETFLWTINEKKEDLDDYYIITDNPYLFI